MHLFAFHGTAFVVMILRMSAQGSTQRTNRLLVTFVFLLNQLYAMFQLNFDVKETPTRLVANERNIAFLEALLKFTYFCA